MAVYAQGATTGPANNYTFVNMNCKLPNDTTIYRIGGYGKSWTSKVKIVKRVGSGNWDVIQSHDITASSTEGWQFITLPSPYTVPSTGDYYVALYLNGSGDYGYTTFNVPRAFISGDMTGTGQNLSEDTNNGGATYADSFVLEGHSASQVISSAGGTYKDTNLIDGNVKSGVTYGVSGTGSYTASGVTVSEIFSGTVGDGTLTLAESMRILLAGMAGKTSGHPLSPVFSQVNGTAAVITATLDASGNRTAVTVTP